MGKSFRGKRALGFLVFVGLFAAAAAVIMLLWNALIPSIIGWSVIGYWQAAGLLVLCRLLFTGMGSWGRHMHDMKHKHMSRMDEVRKQMNGMSSEERREFIRRRMQEFRDGCCEPSDGYCEPEPDRKSAE